jgi:signal peptidase II
MMTERETTEETTAATMTSGITGTVPLAEGESPASTRQRSLMLLMAAVVLVLDQFSKYLIEATLPLYQTWAPIPALAPVFRITHVSNTGTAFGLFPSGSTVFTWVAVLITIAIVYYNYTLPAGQKGLRFALGLQLGGALGNLIDRLRLGHVTDFLDFGPWPVFNLADTSIVAGAILLGWLVLQEQKHDLRAAAPTGAYTESVTEPRGRIEDPGGLDEWSTD